MRRALMMTAPLALALGCGSAFEVTPRVRPRPAVEDKTPPASPEEIKGQLPTLRKMRGALALHPEGFEALDAPRRLPETRWAIKPGGEVPEAPKAEAPTPEDKKVEAPEAPKAEAPTPEDKKVEAPEAPTPEDKKVEAPEAPKAEAPKPASEG